MPLYRQTRLIHIHIPKTAGTAIESFFHSIGDMVWGLESWLGRQYLNHRWYELQHLTMSEFLTLTGDEFRHFQSFAVIRNPYTRLISEFLWRQGLFQARHDSRLIGFSSFREFIEAIPADIDSNWSSIAEGADKKRTNFLIHVRPQHHYLCEPTGKTSVGEILRFEKLKSDLSRFLQHYGLKTDKIVQPPKRDVEPFFDRELFDRVNRIYARDFEFGDYPVL